MSENQKYTPDAKYFAADGKSYPAKRMLLLSDHQYSDNELCTLEGVQYGPEHHENKVTPYLSVPFRTNEAAGAKINCIPHMHLMVNFGRNNARGDEAHKNFAYWRDVGLIRYGGNGFVPQGRTVTPMTNWIECAWDWDEKKQAWTEKKSAPESKGK